MFEAAVAAATVARVFARRAPGFADRRALVLFALVLVGYLAGSELAFRLADLADLQAVLFVPAGLTAGALLGTSPRRWPWVLGAAAIAELAQDLRSGLGVGSSLGFVAANVVEPLLAAVAIRRVVGPRLDLSLTSHVRWFLLLAVAGAPMIGALIGALTDDSLGGNDFDGTFVQWWLGDGLGVLLVGTLIVVWRGAPDRTGVAGMFGVPLLAATVGGTVAVMVASDLPLLFLVLTGVVVAGARFGPRAVAVTSVGVTAAIAGCMVFEDGALLAGVPDGTAVIIVKLKLLVFTAAGLIVSAEVFERERATAAAARLRAEAEAERTTVTRLQHLLLPPEHATGTHFEAFGSYLAGTSALGVGGDWYDVVGLPDGRVFLTVGDVVGRGAGAAAVMGRLRAVMHVLAARSADAGELLTQLDEHADGMIDAFGSTVWAGLFDPATATLSFASAGHPPGFLLPPGQPVTRLDTAVSAPLGVRPDHPKPTDSCRLDGASTIVLYTDGLIERRGESIDVGLARLEGELRAVAGRAAFPEQVVAALLPPDHEDDTVVLAVVLRPAR